MPSTWRLCVQVSQPFAYNFFRLKLLIRQMSIDVLIRSEPKTNLSS